LYDPQNPSVLGAPTEFLNAKRTQSAWKLLDQKLAANVIPAIADTASHFKVRDEIVLNSTSEQPVRLRIVGALRNSVLQSEIIISEANFLQAFPDVEGYRFFLASAPDPQRAVAAMNAHVASYGLNAELASTRFARFHEVEESWASMFETLGAFGLLLSIIGLLAH